MPLYEFVCSREHTTERLAGVNCETVECFTCGAPAKRNPVNRVAYNHFSSPVDFHMTEPMRAAHEEALGRKADAQQQKAEYVGNGWSPS